MFRYALDNLTRNGTIKVLIEDTDDDFPRVAAVYDLTPTRPRRPNIALDFAGDLSYRLGAAVLEAARRCGRRVSAQMAVVRATALFIAALIVP